MKMSRRLLSLAPLVFLAHVAEEAPGLIAWFNRHAEPDLTMSDFFAINAIGLLVTVVIVSSERPFAELLTRARSDRLAQLSHAGEWCPPLNCKPPLPRVRHRDRHRWSALPALLRCRHRHNLPQF